MIPATAPNSTPSSSPLRKGRSSAKASTAPTGSVRPESRVQRKARRRLPVAYHTGMATEIPSGMLCRAMARVMLTPRVRSSYPARKVATPSGKLCRAMASADTKPTRNRFLCGASPVSASKASWGTRWSRAAAQPMPAARDSTAASAPGRPPRDAVRCSRAVGNRSVKDTASITPPAKPRETASSFSLLLRAAKTTSAPSRVDSPAARDSNSARTAADSSIAAYPDFLCGTATIPHRPGFSRAKFLRRPVQPFPAEHLAASMASTIIRHSRASSGRAMSST